MGICVRCLVSGKVQGVFFRASARQQAVSLGITGYARNLSDGRVEVVACGEPHTVDEMKAWLTRGPAAAQVSGVSYEALENQTYANFSVR